MHPSDPLETMARSVIEATSKMVADWGVGISFDEYARYLPLG